MIPVADAQARIRATIAAGRRPGTEEIALAAAHGRVLAEDLVARLTQPPAPLSAMDGWAVRAADVATVPVTLRQVGYVQAGSSYGGTLGPGEAVRIFTGAPVPAGADAVVIQEDVDAEGDAVRVRESSAAGRHIRVAGLDFTAGSVGLRAGRKLTARDVGLAAAMNHPWLRVRRRPRVAILATGDEIVRPGDPVGPNQIVSSNALALAALVQSAGGEPLMLGIAPDDPAALRSLAADAAGADLLVTTGGASVGEHDLIRAVLGQEGLALDFWKIAMRPGKPLMFGTIGGMPLLGLPGNPVSTLICGLLFLKPAIDVMLGGTGELATESAVIGRALNANDRRQDYLRATSTRDGAGRRVATPFPRQDSSMISALAAADCLVIRPPHAPALTVGEQVEILPLGEGSAI